MNVFLTDPQMEERFLLPPTHPHPHPYHGLRNLSEVHLL